MRERERERERDRERERERERERDRQTDRQTDRETQRVRERLGGTLRNYKTQKYNTIIIESEKTTPMQHGTTLKHSDLVNSKNNKTKQQPGLILSFYSDMI